MKKIKRKQIVKSGIHLVDQMDGRLFEEFLLELFKRRGYKGQLTPMTEDYGADLILIKNGRKIVVQAKRWKGVVGIEAVQQVVGAIRHYDVNKGMVITNSAFTENAYALANSNSVELWDRKDLMKLMTDNNEKQLAKEVFVKGYQDEKII